MDIVRPGFRQRHLKQSFFRWMKCGQQFPRVVLVGVELPKIVPMPLETEGCRLGRDGEQKQKI
ncbi:unnamed protein product [Amoebophrya sp. A25]|nr:unnamed protein product [Amoebophrya sp. A25]|eukprot:GSA25T00026669001.1